MTQLSNVPMQPKPDAVERPLTLVEKLERELAVNCRLNNWDFGFKAAIDIVKQHSDWQNLSSDTQLQDGQIDAVIERPQTLIERIQPILDDLMMECFKHGFHQKEMTEAEFIDYSRKNCVPLKREIIGILKQHEAESGVSE